MLMRNLLLIFCLIPVSALLALDWKPISPEQRALKTAKVDPNADAEAIFWEAWVSDVSGGNGYLNHVVENYIRIKLYNDRAVEKYGNVEIPYYSERKMTIINIRARTIKADGTIVELAGGSIVERVVSKSGRKNVKVKSFALTALEPGAIIEYQWTEFFSEYTPRYVTLEMQREIPAWEVIYNVRPYSGFQSNEQMRSYRFNCTASAWEPVNGDVRRQGYVRTRVQNIPAFVDEPQMPAEEDVKAWMLLYYTPSTKEKASAYWPALGKQMLWEFRKAVKVSGEIKQLAQELTAKAQGAFEKADLLATYCLTKIKNVSYNAEGVSSEEKTEFFKNLKENHNTTDTLKLKMGNSDHIQALFYALAEAVGLNPTLVRAGSANSATFRADFFDPYLLRNRMVAIRSGEETHFYNAGIPYLPPGMLDWDEQGQPALFADAKEPKLMILPPTPAAKSLLRRKADLKLAEDGSVSGSVSMQYSGHFAVSEKMRLGEQSDGSREEGFKKRLEARYPGAKISELKIENANSPMGLLQVNFNIAMEGYAQRTGKRLFFDAAFFEFGDKPMFSAASRKYPIIFRHAFTEEDEIRFEYPAGYALDNAEMPGTTKFGEIGEYTLLAKSALDKPLITVNRSFVWGREGKTYFDVKSYPVLKKAFDMIHTYNTHALSLKVK